MDFKSIQELMKSMSSSELTFMEIETDGMRITMKKGNDREIENSIGISDDAKPSVKKETINNMDTLKGSEAFEAQQHGEKSDDGKFFTVVSPIVGTFYSSSTPETPSFVNVGTKVKKGDTLCIVEAMKLMNEIVSEVDGEVIDIFAHNDNMVEYGQELFKIKVI